MNERPQRLFDSLCQLTTAQEFEQFLNDLCTPQEMEALELRWQVAQLIHQGHTVRDVHAKTQASTTTITRVNRSLHYGHGGYQHLLNKLYSKEE